MIKYPLIPKVWEDARAYEKFVRACIKKRRGRFYADLDEKESYCNGYLGEWAFHQFLLDNKVEHKWINEDCSEEMPSTDFIVHNLKWDVKTAAKSYYRKIMTPKVKFFDPHNYHDYYVGAKLVTEENMVYLYGFITRENYAAVPITYPRDKSVPTLEYPLEYLTPLEVMIT